MRNFLYYAIIFITFITYGQQYKGVPNYFNLSYSNPDKYTISEIKVKGAKYLDPGTIVSISGLRAGGIVKIPGDNIQNAIHKLWEQGFLEDVKINILEVNGSEVILEIEVSERPRLSGFEFKGVRKGEADDLKSKIKLIKGKIVTTSNKKATENTIKKFYLEKGFANTQVEIRERKDTLFTNSVVLDIIVSKNKRVKVKSINFDGNETFTDRKLKSKFKKTKQKGILKFYQSHKFNSKLYEEDKQKLITFYQNNGFRDFEILKDTSYYYPSSNPKKQKRNLGINISVKEGRKYYFRNIKWEGNYLYSDSVLGRILNIKKGQVYNKEQLDSKLTFNPNGADVSSLYLDDGYLFFTVDPVEVIVENDSVDIEMRVFEGSQVVIDKINIYGNTKTNDHVILREIRTKPGEKFSRADLILTQRELSQLGYFNPEKIEIQPVPNAQNGTVDINYTLEEKPSDQIQLSGSFGGFGFVGALGLVFNNFSARNIPNWSKWDPLPAGDGQRLSVNVQANYSYRSYSFSFTEPWLGGKKPNSLSVSLSRSASFPYSGSSILGGSYGLGSSNSTFKVTNATVSLAKRLIGIDGRLSIANSLSYSYYQLENYNTFQIGDGNFNNFNINTTLSRNSLDSPQYPTTGGSISVSMALTPPYSLFRDMSKFNELSSNEKFKFVEYHKWMIDYSYFTRVIGKLVVNTRAHFGLLGSYNSIIGPGPFERFRLGGNGLTGYNFILGYDLIGLRGYNNDFLSAAHGNIPAVAYNKFVTEVRYPISLNPMATVFVLGFAEGGNSFMSAKDYNPFQIYRSVGVGARIFMPAFGMIGIDYAFPFDKVPANQFGTQNFVFTIGQQIR